MVAVALELQAPYILSLGGKGKKEKRKKKQNVLL